jgi:tetratricopeptide (TPR) repeat protein
MKFLLSLTASILLTAAVAARADEVYIRTSGSSAELKQTGTIASDDSDGIALNIAGGQGQQVFRLPEIIRSKVKYDCLQRHYEIGRGYENAKEYDLAIGRYEEATKDAAVSKHAKQYAWLRIAVCYEKQAEYDKAAAAYKKVLEEMPKTAFKREVAEGQFNCFVKLGKWEQAAASLAVLEGLGDQGSALAGAMRAELLERKAEAKEGEFSKAADAYKAVARTQPAAEVLCKAHVGAARCLLLDGQASEAVDYARKALAVKGCTPIVAADAHQIIGESLLAGLPTAPKELEQEKNRERALDAIEEMMRPIDQYKGSAWAEARAYYYISLWAERLSAAAVTPAAEWGKRSTWASRELKAKYPTSPNVPKAN